MKVSKPPMAPVDVQTSCDFVTWHDAPSISYEEIDSYHVQFVNSAKNKEFTIHLDASATFYSLHELNEILKKELTYVQVTSIFSKTFSINFLSFFWFLDSSGLEESLRKIQSTKGTR